MWCSIQAAPTPGPVQAITASPDLLRSRTDAARQRRQLKDPCRVKRTTAGGRPIVGEYACNKRTPPGGTWRNESRPSLAPEPFAQILKSWPATPARPRSVETHFSQTPGVGQVGQIQLDLPAVEVEWQEVLRVQAPFGDRAVPLRIRGLARVSQVKRSEHFAALPPTIIWWLRSTEKRRILRRMTYPITADSLCFDPKLHRGSGDAGILDLRDQLRDLPVLAAGD